MVIYEISYDGRTIKWPQSYKYARQYIKQFDDQKLVCIDKHNIPLTKEGLEQILNVKATESWF